MISLFAWFSLGKIIVASPDQLARSSHSHVAKEMLKQQMPARSTSSVPHVHCGVFKT